MMVFLRALAITVFLVLVVGAGVLLFNEPSPPPDPGSVASPLESVDYRAMPAAQTFLARDGKRLVHRSYHGTGMDTVILVHGATHSSASMHVIAQMLQARGATAHSLGMRGHEGDGPRGDVSYIGQMNDDLDDFLSTLPAMGPGNRRILAAFSAGGNFALSVMGGRQSAAFDRYVLIAPSLGPTAPTQRPNAGGITSVAVPRFLVLQALNRIGVTAFNYLDVAAFAVPDEGKLDRAHVFTYRMLMSFGGRTTFENDIRRAKAPVRVVAGRADEVFRSEQYEPVLAAVRPDIRVTLVPEMNHLDMLTNAGGVAVVVDNILVR